MASTDINGEPVLILRIDDIQILEKMLDIASTPNQSKVIRKITDFLNDPQCTEWIENHDKRTD